MYNARILTMEKDRPVFFGEVWVKDEKIVYVAEDRLSAGHSIADGALAGRSMAEGALEGHSIEEGALEDQSIEERASAGRPSAGGFRPGQELPEIKWDMELDCGGNLLMPGFKNAHTHSGMTFLRSFADDVPLQKWLNEKVFPMEARLSGEDIYHLARLAVLEYLTSGITAIFDMYLNPDETAAACMDTGMRCVLTSGLNQFTSSVKQQEE